jgi:hypothetical protein
VEETPIFKGPLPGSTDAPDGAAQISAAVEWVEDLLTQMQNLLLGEPKAGDILVVNGTNDPVYKALTGDVTVNSSGVTAIGNEKVTAAMLKNLAATTAKIAEEAVTTAKLANLGTTTAKLAELAVTAAKLANEAVETGKLKNLAVTTAKIALENVTTALIADGAVTEGKVADGAVTSRKLKPDFSVLDSGAISEVSKSLEVKKTVAVPSIAIVTAVIQCEATEPFGFVQGRGYSDASEKYFAEWVDSAKETRGTLVLKWQSSLTAAEHAFKVSAEGNAGTSRVKRVSLEVLIFAS